MEWYEKPTVEPDVIFPVGAVLEDNKGIYKVIKEVEKHDKAHVYKVEVLTQKEPIPDEFKQFLNSKIQYLLVFSQNLPAIKRLE